MKILIIANVNSVFGNELKENLEKEGIDVYLVDFASLLIKSRKNHLNERFQEKLSKFLKIPKLHMFFRLFYLKEIIEELNPDVINIHMSRWVYVFLLPWLSKYKYVITFYGSDFYKTSKFVKLIQHPFYKKAFAITFTNPELKKKFLKFFPSLKNKSYVCRFGLRTLEFIDKNRYLEKKKAKIKVGFDPNKIIVTCGYNANENQQHEKIIKELVKLDKEIKNKLQFVFPLTYGNKKNREKIKRLLSKTDLDYIILEKFLYGDENALIKLASDIMINLQKTDSFSGSMQEYIYAGNIVITGNWLPYKLFDNLDIEYIKIRTVKDLSSVLENLVKSGYLYLNTEKNSRIIRMLSLWKNNINCWMKVLLNAVENKC